MYLVHKIILFNFPFQDRRDVDDTMLSVSREVSSFCHDYISTAQCCNYSAKKNGRGLKLETYKINTNGNLRTFLNF